MKRQTYIAFLLFISGCSSLSNETYYGTTTYQAPGGSPDVGHETAERDIVNHLLAKQVWPPLDLPLQAESVTLPPYPAYLARRGVTGLVKVLFTVDRAGVVRDAAASGSAPKELEEIALRAVRMWKFAPATRNGVPTELRLSYSFNFTVK